MSPGTYELDIGVDPAAHIFVNEGTFIDGQMQLFRRRTPKVGSIVTDDAHCDPSVRAEKALV
jgi:hypothetical protein